VSASSKIHFSGLNSLRFFAAYFVVLHHSETIRHKFGLPNFESFSFFQNGMLAVSFFFVLSGFLITYLLLVELQKRGDISLPKFYMRRVLRIFPLYYLLVFIGLGLIPIFLHLIHYPNTQPYDTATGTALFAVFLSFVVNALYGSHFLEPLWSIGVEEYFYLIWAPLFKFFKRHILWVIGAVIFFKSGTVLFFTFQKNMSPTMTICSSILLSLKFELMAIGGLGAYAVFKNRQKLENLFYFHPIAQVLGFSLLAARLWGHSYFVGAGFSVYTFLFQTPLLGIYTEGVLFLWLIINTAVNPRSLLTLDYPLLEKLGEISYGIYMYQMLVIFGIVLIFKRWLLQMPPSVSHLFFYACISLGVVGIAWLSKHFFENRFLALKTNYIAESK
jgi:peptidoglycan/LPS O-acetylase OafA/YrhL